MVLPLKPFRRHILGIAFGLIALAGLSWSQTPAVSAQETATSFSVESIGQQVGLGDADLRQTVINVIRWALGFMTLVAVAYMIYGGIVWMTSAGNEERIEKAKRTILQAAIGLVIILLAWAIVFFVVRNFEQVTRNNSGGPGGCETPPCGPVIPPPSSSFDVTAVATCAARPDYDTNVPRTSRVAVIFNARPKEDIVKTAVEDPSATNPHVAVEKCVDGTCATKATPPIPAYLGPQEFSGTKALGVDNNSKNEWVLNRGSLTFYHTSFSDNPTDPDYHYFDDSSSWEVSLPRAAAANALIDQKNRSLQKCQRSPGQPIEGDETLGENCTSTGDEITWKFKTAPSSADVNGPVLNVKQTFPTSQYIGEATKKPSRNVNLKPVLGVEFTNAIDPARVSLDNFQVFKYSTAPNPNNGSGGTRSVTPLPNSMFDFDFNSNGTGILVSLVGDNELEPFTWYHIQVKDFESLCGRPQDPNPFTWVFETNDERPGVRRVYPRNNFKNACPDTRVFVQFNTSMFKAGTPNCEVGVGGYVADGAMVSSGPAHGRTLTVTDPYPGTGDANNYCRTYSFTPESATLKPGITYHVGVNTTLPMNKDGTVLVVGDKPPANADNDKPWSFTVDTPEKCFQEPVITSLSPSTGPGGACISVLGHYFTAAGDTNDTPEPGDQLTLGGKNQSKLLNWEEDSIVSRVEPDNLPVNAKHPYVVSVKHGPDVLKSDPESFRLTDDAAGIGPCLAKISPKSGPVGTQVTAVGEQFGAAATGKILYDLHPSGQWDVSSAGWGDTRITNITVKNGSAEGVGTMSVLQGAAESNGKTFTITAEDSRAPKVAETTTCDFEKNIFPSPNPRKSDTNVCLNSPLAVRFTKAMEPGTLVATNIQLRKQGTSTNLPATNFVKDADAKGFTFTPARFDPATTYEVTLTSNLTSASPENVPMSPYVWTFTTQTDNADCKVDKVGISSQIIPPAQAIDATPPSYTFRQAPYKLNFEAQAFSAACHRLGTGGLQFTWSSTKEAVLKLEATTGVAVIGGSPLPNPQVGSANVNVKTQSLSAKPVVVKYDELACKIDSHCKQNSANESCGASACVDAQCTPVINSIDPPAGAVGTWTTIKGCWFGAYSAGQSKVVFTDNKEAQAPDPAICGQPAETWKNNEIVRVVPAPEEPPTANDPSNDAVDGPVQVIRADSLSASSANPFDVDPTKVLPGICGLTPENGPVGTPLLIDGTRFETRQPGDQATITPKPVNSLAVAMTDYGPANAGWKANEISTVLPTVALGWGDVRVTHIGNTSNSLSFKAANAATGGSGTCANSCSDSTICPAAPDGRAQSCGNDSCCHIQPTIVSTVPTTGSTAICRNAQVNVTFDQLLDPKSVTNQTIHYLDGSRQVDGKIKVSNSSSSGADRGVITYQPGILGPNAPQKLFLTTEQATPMTVQNPSFETPISPADWSVSSKTSSSTDQPPGQTGKSILADCSTCPNPSNEQAFVAQNIPNTNISGKTYRVTGWVKAEVGQNSQAGLVTQCSNQNGCGYKVSYNPGLFTANSGGWKKIILNVTRNANFTDVLRITCYANRGSKVWCDDIKLEEITAQPTTTIRSIYGVLAKVTTGPITSPISFTTSPDICQIDAVTVLPNEHTFNASQGPLSSWTYTAEASAKKSPLQNLPEFPWKWSWQSKDESLIKLQTNPAEESSSIGQTIATAQNKNGQTQVEACAVPTTGKKICRAADAAVDLCTAPWNYDTLTLTSGFADESDNCDSGACQNFHFFMSYCRDRGAQPLPDFAFKGIGGKLGAIEGVNATDPTRLKSYFFKESTNTRDTIGLLIFKNDQLLSPADWYAARFPADRGASNTTVSGYPAVRTGTTTYIGVTDIEGTTRRGLIFVLDYNSNSASPATKDIYEQLLKSLRFTTNVSQPLLLQKDTRRIQDVTNIKNLLAEYKKVHGAYPKLEAGSYLSGLSFSVWPSWQNTLGDALDRSVPVDPINTFQPSCQVPNVPAGDYEPKACWSEKKKSFQCPTDSHIYGYSSNGLTYTLYARMEYLDDGSYATSPTVPLNACAGIPGSACACFNFSSGS